jgi:mono/diheme cytochrome c family protein
MQLRRAAFLSLLLLLSASSSEAGDKASGKALLEKNCGRCHALEVGLPSPLKEAPNLWIVLRSYPVERLEFELSEGIGSRHKEMPQVQFTSEDITSIEEYLFGE